MAYNQKTLPSESDVREFIEQVEHPRKREDAWRLVELFTEETGEPPVMWGDSIIGFGQYHYQYPSGHEGRAPLAGFSPRKSAISLYFATGDDEGRQALLADFGKHKTGKACVYINKLEDVDEDVLRKLIVRSVVFLQDLYPDPS
ncbi:DUF1801 domain-containing protein [Salisediminibacterium beveridgei]|uniref:YdhG-like domain-containing protein n=1 Tax=Salisediminibacterium beveridgei TaxID=632773 RepID=A0A1D7QZJ3_9BACI|nr:DUF1801 domain-containing protein [Salisediminibacterium beveridgei]AOM84380.1 hypothetical protein BBEV_3062 [Salisediminibacterium beveridgei]